MDHDELRQFIEDSRLCSSTEKCAVACATDDLKRAPWCDNLAEAWASLDSEQKSAVKLYRENHSLVPFSYGLDPH